MLIFLGIFWIVCGILTYGLIIFDETDNKYSDKIEMKQKGMFFGCLGPIGLISTIIDIKLLGHKLGLKWK